MLSDKVALVTDGTGGIGFAVAEALAVQGCAIMLNGLGDAKEIERARAGLADQHGVKVCYSDADLTDPPRIEKLVAATARELGAIDILVNCAGLQHVEPIETFPVETWDAIIAINLSAIFHTTRLVIPYMRARNWGRIVNIASAHGLVASPYKVPYIASKHGVVGFTKGTALEVGDWGITCNAICPGFVDTAMFQVQAEGLATTLGVPKEQVIGEQVADKQAIKDVISVEEIAATVAFLCSDAARSITAAAIPVDGGWTAK